MALSETAEGINKILTEYHQLDTLRLAAPSASRARTRILSDWQRAVDYFYVARNWHFRYEDADISVTFTGTPISEIDLPTPWGNEGRDGVFWSTTFQSPLGWISLRDIKTMQLRYPTESGTTRHYSVRSNKALIFPALIQDATFHAQYQRKKPALEDTDGVTSEGYDNGGLEIIPDQWWETVLFEYAKLLEMKHVGSASEAVIQKQLVEDMIFNVCMEESQGKTTPDYMPRFPGSASVWEVDIP